MWQLRRNSSFNKCVAFTAQPLAIMTVQGGIGGTKTARGFTVEVTAHGNMYSGSFKVKKIPVL